MLTTPTHFFRKIAIALTQSFASCSVRAMRLYVRTPALAYRVSVGSGDPGAFSRSQCVYRCSGITWVGGRVWVCVRACVRVWVACACACVRVGVCALCVGSCVFLVGVSVSVYVVRLHAGVDVQSQSELGRPRSVEPLAVRVPM